LVAVSPPKPRDPGVSDKTRLRGLAHDRAGVVSGTWKALGEIHESLPRLTGTGAPSSSSTMAAAEARPPSPGDARSTPPGDARSSSRPISSGRMPAAGARPTSSSTRMPVARAARVRVVQAEAPAESAMVTIRARCHDDLLEYTHKFVGSYTRSRFRGALADGLSVAAWELLGNALNYGSVLGDVVFEIIETPKSVAVRVANDTVQVRLDMLCSHLERVSRDPEAAFLEEMRRSTGAGISRPMLGLARVVHESKMILDVYISGTRVTVAASSPM
jgi:hypothetical protein